MNENELPVLMIDDDEIALKFYSTVLESYGITNFKKITDSREALPYLSENQVLLVLLDLNMPHISGIELLKEINKLYPNIPVIVITADNKVELAVECIKIGAFDFLVKPVQTGRLFSVIKHTIEINDLKQEVNKLSTQVLHGQLKNPKAFQEIITNNDSMKSIFKYIEAISQSPKAVLVTGESGTGKELIARVIHKLTCKNDNFVAVNVSGLDDTVFSDTLFGHKKGSFTGADSERKGLIVQAANGTLFLDEIGDLDNNSQLKLLRLLQEGEYYPLGSDVPEKSQANIVSATNADLKFLLKKNIFRNDLYYRLISHHINIPPLRERFDDLPLLIDYFLMQSSKSLNKSKPTPPKELVTLLQTYYFPGNIRELQSMIHDAVSLHESGILSLKYFKEFIKKNTENISATEDSDENPISYSGKFPTLKEVEDYLINEALKKSKGNQSIAADLLGINQSTLSRRLKENT
jgi:DNA-binding NtrC family response regulator